MPRRVQRGFLFFLTVRSRLSSSASSGDDCQNGFDSVLLIGRISQRLPAPNFTQQLSLRGGVGFPASRGETEVRAEVEGAALTCEAVLAVRGVRADDILDVF